MQNKNEGSVRVSTFKTVKRSNSRYPFETRASCVHFFLQVGIAAGQIKLGRIRVCSEIFLCLSGHLIQMRRGELSPPATHVSAECARPLLRSSHHLSRLNSVSVALCVGGSSFSCTNAQSSAFAGSIAVRRRPTLRTRYARHLSRLETLLEVFELQKRWAPTCATGPGALDTTFGCPPPPARCLTYGQGHGPSLDGFSLGHLFALLQ